jgi:hypothetical protein
MGKNVSRKKPDFGGMVKDTINTTTPTDTTESTSTDTVTYTDTPTYTPAHVPNKKAKERKTERLQLVVRPSTKARLAQYAEDHDTSSNEVVQRLLDKLLDDAGY